MSSTYTHGSHSGSVRPARGTVFAALGAVGLISAAALLAAAPAEARTGSHRSQHAAAHVFQGPLTDLQPASSSPLDRARAKLVFAQHHGSSTFVLVVSGVGAGGVGHTYGAHLHKGACVAGNGAAAGAHYNQSTENGVVPPIVNDQTEVWLDISVGPDGSGVAVAKVPFVPTPANRSIVLHEQHTDDHGTAGARLACLPVSWS
jgi:Cu-Zn family superoxide dismutase